MEHLETEKHINVHINVKLTVFFALHIRRYKCIYFRPIKMKSQLKSRLYVIIQALTFHVNSISVERNVETDCFGTFCV